MSGSRQLPAADVCVVGSFMTDFTARVHRRPAAGETVIADGLDITLGGKGFNQAVASARSGARTRMHGCVGWDEFGAAFLASLDMEDIQGDTVIRDRNAGTGIGLPLVDADGQNTIVVAPRANGHTGPDNFDEVERAAAACRVLLLQLEVPFELSAHAARTAKANGALVILNPAPANQPLDALAHLADVLVPNRTEAAQLTGLPDAAPDEVARTLAERTGRPVIVTMDSDGVYVVDGDGSKPRWIDAHRVTTFDSVGAGDAFCGALGARLAFGDDLYRAAEYANAAGAICVTRAGASPAIPSRSEIHELLGRRRSEPARAVGSHPGQAGTAP